MSEYFDRQGKPITMLDWSNKFIDKKYKRVAFDTIGNVDVSTVWLGMNQYGDGPPLIFETMVFNGPMDSEQARYSTEEQALDGHAAMVERVRAHSVNA